MVATLGTKTSGMRGGWMGHGALEEHIEGGQKTGIKELWGSGRCSEETESSRVRVLQMERFQFQRNPQK